MLTPLITHRTHRNCNFFSCLSSSSSLGILSTYSRETFYDIQRPYCPEEIGNNRKRSEKFAIIRRGFGIRYSVFGFANCSKASVITGAPQLNLDQTAEYTFFFYKHMKCGVEARLFEILSHKLYLACRLTKNA